MSDIRPPHDSDQHDRNEAARFDDDDDVPPLDDVAKSRVPRPFYTRPDDKDDPLY